MQQEAGNDGRSQAKTDEQKRSTCSLANQSGRSKPNVQCGLFGVLQDTDMPATMQAVAAVGQSQIALKKAVQEWETLKSGMK